uniref:Rhomboid domain containing 1 n=1 Tax=Oreochromis aureus TaxID=47969 RepID=A0A668RTD8_OREAU
KRYTTEGSQLGLLLLASQVFQLGLNNIPPITLAVLALNVYLYLFPAAPLFQACVSVQQAYWLKDWHDWHLYFNMVSFLWKGRRLEQRLGGPWFLYLLSVFSLLTGLVYLVLEALKLTELMQDQSYSMACAVGFSGVLFALKVLNNHYYPGSVTYVMGLPVSSRYASWVELVLIHITSPGHKHPPLQPLNIQGMDIEAVDSYRYLGVHLNNKLDWTHNSDALYRKGQSRLYLLRRLRSFGVEGPLLKTFVRSKYLNKIFFRRNKDTQDSLDGNNVRTLGERCCLRLTTSVCGSSLFIAFQSMCVCVCV